MLLNVIAEQRPPWWWGCFLFCRPWKTPYSKQLHTNSFFENFRIGIYIMHANIFVHTRGENWFLTFPPKHWSTQETEKIIIDYLLFLFDRTHVQEETSVIIQPGKDSTESYVSTINHVKKLMCSDRVYVFEWTLTLIFRTYNFIYMRFQYSFKNPETPCSLESPWN